MSGRKSEKEYEQDLLDIWDKYIEPAYKNKPSYYIEDKSNCANDTVEYIVLCESPHKDEVKLKTPLVGKSGTAVSEFLFYNDKKSIGEWIKEDYQKEESKKELPFMAIVNVCNVPLQKISKNKRDIKGLNLNYVRDNCKTITKLKDNLKERLSQYTNARTIIVCGEFAQAYYDEIKTNFPVIKPLYVPHPSRNQWRFVYEHKDDISTLKWIFDKKEKG